jgi:tryptophanase
MSLEKKESTRTLCEPFRIKMIEPIRMTTEDERKQLMANAGFNPFLLLSDDVFIDLLTDSGTGAMSDRQWAGMMTADESYAGARSWIRLENEVKDLTGMKFVFPTHQGRAAERILYSILGGNQKIFISNTHFDTTRANIEFTGAKAYDLVPDYAQNPALAHPFKGNIDLQATIELLQKTPPEMRAAVIITVTNNSAGGQPVSMENIRALRNICNEYKVPLVIDGCRIAENAYFIKHHEAGYASHTYREIAQEILSYGDAFIMSAKKDGMVNMGGLLTLNNPEIAEQCKNLLIISEGFATYGGLTGRDMDALAIGLREVFDDDYLHYRIRSTAYVGEHLDKLGIPVVLPIGGHAVYVDAAAMYPDLKPYDFPGQILVCELYSKGGIRAVEIGSVMFGSYAEDGQFVPAAKELVRLAIPRRVYTQSHMDYVIDIFRELKEEGTPNYRLKMIYEPPFLRHFTARFEKINL